MKIQGGGNIEETIKWAYKIEQELEICDGKVSTVNNTIAEWKRDENEKAKQTEEQMAGKLRQEILKEQLQFDKVKHEQKVEHKKELEEIRKAQEKAKNSKLLKLVISKFNETTMDCMRFWNQLEVEIDKAQITPVTKFSYLGELVGPKVLPSIDGWPGTTERYERAKNILRTKYGYKSEMVNTRNDTRNKPR